MSFEDADVPSTELVSKSLSSYIGLGHESLTKKQFLKRTISLCSAEILQMQTQKTANTQVICYELTKHKPQIIPGNLKKHSTLIKYIQIDAVQSIRLEKRAFFSFWLTELLGC